jgi:uncharacterized protein with GYD domain
MSKYLIHGSYSPEGAKGLLRQGGSSRREQITQTVKASGGALESLYWAFGDADFFAIADLPDAATAAAIGLTLSGSGAVRTSITVLLTAEDIDEAMGKTVEYRPPGSTA